MGQRTISNAAKVSARLIASMILSVGKKSF
jgi:hypothetical protein